MKKSIENKYISFLLTIFSTILCIFGAEIFLRLKNSTSLNYDVEMTRYSNLLKVKSQNEIMDFEHKKNANAKLQGVNIRINKYGLRGGEVKNFDLIDRRIIVLGGSVTLGWGVEENFTMTSVLEEMFKKDSKNVEVLNAGIGNYNSERYVERFFENLEVLKPTDILVNYFLRDAEILFPAKQNYFLKNSQLALTLWLASNRFNNSGGKNSVYEHYKRVYSNTKGINIMKKSLKRLSDYAKSNNINLYMLITPDITNISNYRLNDVHDLIKSISNDLGYISVDSLQGLRNFKKEELFAMPGDPHPNNIGHKVMAETIYPVISK